MAIKKFKATITQTKEYIISIDDKIYDERFMKTFSDVLHPIEELEDIAKDLAYHQANYGNEGFIEGYGVVSRNTGPVLNLQNYKKAEGLHIDIIEEDDQPYIEIEEL